MRIALLQHLMCKMRQVFKGIKNKIGLIMGRTLKRNVHYRVCENAGMMSDIKTVFI